MHPIQQRLRALAQDAPELKDAARIYEVIWPLLWSADLHPAPVSITVDQARAKMEKGLPLLYDLELELDGQAAHKLMISLAYAVEAMGEKNQAHAMAARQVRLALEEDRLDAGILLSAVATGEVEPVMAAIQNLQLDPGMVWTLAQNAFKPALRAWCRQLAPGAAEIAWHQGYCFVCGAPAMLGELQDNDQVKHLRCGQCGADWPFRRLECTYCGNEDHNTLGYLYSENQREKMRVEVCDKCHGYLKVIAAFAPTSPDLLPVEDLTTLHLDYIAQERGYSRGQVQFIPHEIFAAALE